MGLDGDVGDVPILGAVIDRTGEAIADPSNDGSSVSSMSGEKSKGFLLVSRLGVLKGAAVLALLCESKERGEVPLAKLLLSRIIDIIPDISEWGQGGGSFPSASELVRKPYSSDLTTALGPMFVVTSLPSSPSDASLTIDAREPRDVLLGRLMLNPPLVRHGGHRCASAKRHYRRQGYSQSPDCPIWLTFSGTPMTFPCFLMMWTSCESLVRTHHL